LASRDDIPVKNSLLEVAPTDMALAIHDRAGSAMEISGSSVQSSTHRNDAMLEMSMRRSFHEEVAASCIGDGSFVDGGVNTDKSVCAGETFKVPPPRLEYGVIMILL